MTVSNGNNGGAKTTVMWLSLFVAACGACSTVTFMLTKASIDTTNEQLREIKQEMKSFTAELSTRVEAANKIHSAYDIRLDRIETKVGLR